MADSRRTDRSKFAPALEHQLQELNKPVPSWMWDRLFAQSELWRKALTEPMPIADRPARQPGRPKAADSSNVRTSEAYNAALFVHLQMRKFRERKDSKSADCFAREE